MLQKFAMVKYGVFVAKICKHALCASTVRDIWWSPLARQLLPPWPRVNLAYQRADFARASFVNDARTSRKFLEGERVRAPCVNDAQIFWGKFCSGNDARLKFSKLTHFQIFAQFSKFSQIFQILPEFQNFA